MAANYQIYRPEWRGWKPGECKSFFAAIEQHRRAAWRVTLVSAFATSRWLSPFRCWWRRSSIPS